ncbi:MAG: transcription antitermination factor NusB [Chloroflexi bacterium]|nr:transcription antitermination factor NusB [Chloroflexota bacterium]
MPGPRRKARIAILQALYEVDLTGHPLGQAMNRLIEEEGLTEEAARFARETAGRILENRVQIDSTIARFATAFPVDQISAIDRNILRLAIYEASIDNRTAPKIAINEAIEIAKVFGSESSSRFINGVLGSVLAGKNAPSPP